MDEPVIVTERHGGVLVARCHGSLDLASRDDLRDGLPSARDVAAPGVGAVVVDLSGVPFLDCSALGAFVVLARGCAAAGVRLLFAGARPLVRRLLTALEFDRLFLVVPSWQDAVTLAETWTDVHGRPDPRPAPADPAVPPARRGAPPPDGGGRRAR